MDIKKFPIQVKFQKEWRSYQKRILSELEEHFDDNRLHVVAAPGSGKTVLGLEVIVRLNQPTLILAPTLTIRNQWIDRFTNLFLPPDSKIPDWITTDIKNPQFLTVSTYQALHSVYSGLVDEEEIESEEEVVENGENNYRKKNNKIPKVDVVALLRNLGTKTILVDEAHHLRNEWWQTLIAVRDGIENVKTVALTATPPYDVSELEWARYQEFCGPVDAEISVPELVLEGNLCPHQDYIYFSSPSAEEGGHIREFRSNVEKFYSDFCSDQNFINALRQHPWVQESEKYAEDILENPDFFSSLAIFLNHTVNEIPKGFSKIMGLNRQRLPQLNLEWMEILLTGCLYTDISRNITGFNSIIEDLKHRLSQIGAIEKKKIILRNTKEISKILARSITKLNNISEIVKLESSCLGNDLHMVILTDYIIKSELPDNPEDIKPLKRIGVVPIFEQLRRESICNARLGILSGSLVVIPLSSIELMKQILTQNEVKSDEFKITPLKHDKNFAVFELEGHNKQKIVKIITRFFSLGGVNVLVGTKSLLGEGWDAPTINSLILASFVGTYMLSNQMRGRAIRSQPDNHLKTANIWHLVCVEEDKKEPGDDFETLTRRFKAFLGVSYEEKIIENGIKRLKIGAPPFTKQNIEVINSQMKERALDRNGLRISWEEALKRGQEGIRIVEEIETKSVSLPRGFVFYNTIAALFWQGILWGGFIFSKILEGVGRSRDFSLKQYSIYIGIAFVIAALVALPKCLKALWLFLWHVPIESSMKQIGEALLRTMTHTSFIKTDIYKLKIKAEEGRYGTVFCSLDGGSSFEKSIYLDAFQEILDPMENPRYLITRKSLLGRLLRKDYYSVPQIIGARKEHAEYFAKMWKKYVGDVELVYTRNEEGRKILLKARANALSTSFQKRSERRSCWK